MVAAARMSLWKADLEADLPRAAEAPFTSERKRMTTVHDVPDEMREVIGGRWVAFVKGAPDGLIDIAGRG